MSGTESALAGLRVVEVGGMVPAAYAAKLLADMGAEVIKVETPEGDPARRRGPFPPGREGDPEASGLFLYLNANKLGVTLDLTAPADREVLLDLLATADVFIHNLEIAQAKAARVDYTAIRGRLPRLVYTWITPYGLSGPKSGWQAENITIAATGGWASVTPGRSPYPELPPLLAHGQQTHFQAAAHAAVATMGALFARRRTGRGQLVELSEQEVIAAALELAFVTYTYTGRVASRLGVRSFAPSGIIQCNDGLIFVMANEDHMWDAFVHVMGDPEWAGWEIFSDRTKRSENQDVLMPLIDEWMRQHTVQEVFDMAATARLPFAPVSSIGDMVASPHLKARGFFATIRHPAAGEVQMPGAPYLLSETPWTLRSPAPLLGQHNGAILHQLRPAHV